MTEIQCGKRSHDTDRIDWPLNEDIDKRVQRVRATNKSKRNERMKENSRIKSWTQPTEKKKKLSNNNKEEEEEEEEEEEDEESQKSANKNLCGTLVLVEEGRREKRKIINKADSRMCVSV